MLAVQPRLSIVRPGALPRQAPSGRAARELAWDGFVDHPGYGVTPQMVLGIFREAESGWPQRQCDLIDDLIETDGTLRNLFEQREGAIAGKPHTIEADGADVDSTVAAEVLSLAIEKLAFDEVLAHQLTSTRFGWACTEIEWGLLEHKGRRWVVPIDLINVPARRFLIDVRTDELKLRTAIDPTKGESLAPGKWWVTRLAATRIARAGLMRTAAWYALYKRYGTRDWVVYAEKYGLPLTIVHVPENASDAVKEVARSIVDNIGNDGGAIVEVPEGREIKVEIISTTPGDSASTHGSLITYCNREMSKLVNGSTLANDNADSGGASYALGEVHAATRWETVQRDDARIRGTFRNQFAAAFCHFNGLTGRPPVLEIQVVRDLEPSTLISAAKELLAFQVDVSISQLRGVSGLYAPLDERDSVLAKAKPEPAPVAPDGEEDPAPDDEEPEPPEPVVDEEDAT